MKPLYTIISLKMRELWTPPSAGLSMTGKRCPSTTKTVVKAITHYKVLERFGQFTYIQCTLETGRTHQIRVHMSSIGHPLLGDTVYGPGKMSLFPSGSDTPRPDSRFYPSNYRKVYGI